MKYKVKQTDKRHRIDADWQKEQWAGIQAVELKNYMGQKPEHFPKTETKVLYDSENVYVIFRVEDKYVKAVAENYNDEVCCDSCVEFFFTPGEDASEGYFNLEMNCGGTILMYHQLARDTNVIILDAEDLKKITVKTSLPKIISTEITKPTIWMAEYKIPVDMLEKYAPVQRPASGVRWRANFYKCGDQTSKPHWLTWSAVDLPEPDFHQPKFFGEIEFS